jgi:hypothetical protein
MKRGSVRAAVEDKAGQLALLGGDFGVGRDAGLTTLSSPACTQ